MNIKIMIACHKPSELPDNPLFLPVHVGSETSKITMPGLQCDNQGENISAKNPTFCELTAQYWGWKNLEADYYGLCHYRRFLSFSKIRHTNFANDGRGQILARIITPKTLEKYGLLDEEYMRQVIEANDILTAEPQDLSKVWTPRGYQKSVWMHWVAHDRALIKVKDLEQLMSLIEVMYPEYIKDAWDYMHNKYFLGYNTFIMKREYFQELCAFEFSVLSELEKKVDLSNYNQQLSRIFGFMGEILYSIFVYHKRQAIPNLKVKELQMVYFEKTDPLKPMEPITDAMPLAFNVSCGVAPFLPGIAFQTFLKNFAKDKKYDLLFLYFKNLPLFYKQKYMAMVQDYANITLRFVDVSICTDENYELTDGCDLPLKFALPWILLNYEKILLVDWNVIFKADVSEIFQLQLEKCLAAAKDIYRLGAVNGVFDREENYLRNKFGIKEPLNFFDTTILLYNLQKIRKLYSLREISSWWVENKKLQKLEDNMHLFVNIYFQDEVEFLDQKWNYCLNTDEGANHMMSEVPLYLWQEYRETKGIICRYGPDRPCYILGQSFDVEYWQLVDQNVFKILYYNLMLDTKRHFDVKAAINRILPLGSGGRNFVKHFISRDTFIYQELRKIKRALLGY